MCGGGGAPRDSAGSGATEEGLTSRGGRNLTRDEGLLFLHGLESNPGSGVELRLAYLMLLQQWERRSPRRAGKGVAFLSLATLFIEPSFCLFQYEVFAL